MYRIIPSLQYSRFSKYDLSSALVNEVSSIATLLIQNIIHPLFSRKITNLPLQQCPQGLQSALSNTHEHMKMWQERRSRRMLGTHQPAGSWKTIGINQLMAHYTLLMVAMQVVNHIKGYNLIIPPHNIVCLNCPPFQEKKKKDKGKGSEVLDFFFGESVS